MTDGREKLFYAFEDFRLDPVKRLLFDERGELVPLMPKAVEILLYLLRNAGKVVEKDELMSEIWPDTIVEENNLTQNISALRRALGEKHRENRFIATVPGRGYKFVADVRELNAYGLSMQDPLDSLPADDPHASDVRGEQAAQRTGDARASRFWLVTLALLCLLGLSSLGFFLWRENSNAAAPIRSIAVLPFKPLVLDQRDEALELGMADTLISKLAGSDQLDVRPFTAVRRFNSLDQDSVDAGRKLGVDAVLDGNIRISNGRIRVSANLLRVNDGKQLWAGKFDEASTDLFAVQDSISDRVASALKIRLSGREKRHYTENVEAYQLYQRGRFHAFKLILPEVQKGVAYYEQAIAIDPNYALAYVGIAEAQRALILTNDIRPRDVMTQSTAAATRAVEIDNSLAEAWVAVANNTFWYKFDPQTAEKQYIRALELDSNNASAHLFYAHLLSNIGRPEQALSEIKRAKELDPVNLLTNSIEGQILFFAGKDDDALEVLQKTIELEPNFWLSHLFISRIYIRRGMYPEAIAAASKARDLTGGNSEATATVGYTLAASGDTEGAQMILRELESRERYVPPYTIAQLYTVLGDREKALSLLERSFSEHDALMVFLKIEPKLDPLRSEPRFVELMKRMNLE